MTTLLDTGHKCNPLVQAMISVKVHSCYTLCDCNFWNMEEKYVEVHIDWLLA